MGRVTGGVIGMKLRAGDEVIAAMIADDTADLLVVTENGYGKRTRVSEYPRKGRGTMGVKTVRLTEARGQLAGAQLAYDGYQVMLMSTAGQVIRMPTDGIRRAGRSTQGVIVMRLREKGEKVSGLAPVVESESDTGDAVEMGHELAGPVGDSDAAVEPDEETEAEPEAEPGQEYEAELEEEPDAED